MSMQAPTIIEALRQVAYDFNLTMEQARELMRTPIHPETMRDEFAMAALAGLAGLSPAMGTYSAPIIAKHCYSIADAMLTVRGKKAEKLLEDE